MIIKKGGDNQNDYQNDHFSVFNIAIFSPHIGTLINPLITVEIVATLIGIVVISVGVGAIDVITKRLS